MKANQARLFKKASCNIVECEHANEVIILHFEDKKYYALNPTAKLLWQWLDIPISVPKLAYRLAGASGNSASQCEIDILQWLEDCLLKKLVEFVGSEEKSPESKNEFNYLPPKTNTLDLLAADIQGSHDELQTDNLETGS